MSEENAIESITRRVTDMYERFPYPSPEAGKQRLKELSNLLTIFSRETGYDFRNKRVLDAGTGTGHRLLEAASMMKETSFLAVDASERPLAIARETAESDKIDNVEFRLVDLMDDNSDLGQFNVILCMGVLHHLADQARGMNNLTRHLTDEGILFLYVYGKHGSYERMRRKRIISLLLGDGPSDFDQGIKIVKDLGFDSFLYGWNLNIDDVKTKESLCVDSYLNVHEYLFDTDSIFSLVKSAGLDAFMTYGLSVEQAGYLFETRLDAPQGLMVQRTDIAKKLTTPLLAEAYEKMTLLERYRLIDLLYQPNGYTVIAMKSAAEKHFDAEGRVIQNLIRIAES